MTCINNARACDGCMDCQDAPHTTCEGCGAKIYNGEFAKSVCGDIYCEDCVKTIIWEARGD